ncbi:MAG: polyphosphate:AMP phosphotransferase [Planctomycetes bacterium]|nr:polyphosphate:AMP phosphotransferase [Planctomycetota bacterium]
MFESAELGHAIEKKVYDREVPKLRAALLDAQYDVGSAKRFPVLILIGGVDGAGKGETVNTLNEWMDPRYIHTHAFGLPNDEESEHPEFWRFWRALPPKGRIGIFFGHWYTTPILRRVYGDIDDGELDRQLTEISRFEKMLTDEGILLLKFWFHLSKDRQRKRLKELSERKKTRWRVTESDWKHFKLYDKFRKISERSLRETSREQAAWTVVEGMDRRYREVTVGKAILAAIQERLKSAPPAKPADVLPVVSGADRKRILGALDLSKKVDEETYEERLEELQGRLNLLLRDPDYRRISTVAVFEGCDAAGKGGAVRRVTQALDARQYRVLPVAAPTDEEKAQPYLWRFWRHIPHRGRLVIFDRSWYGRVLVERVEGFCSRADWTRAYSEINDFEEQLVHDRIVVAKFWLQISKEQQLARFKAREKTRFKRFKITEEDWRNRKKWDAYQSAVCDMVDRTSTELAPWTLVAAEDKRWARLQVLETLCRRIEKTLKKS